ncbi:MAG: beta-ketoacyl-[acyl-carrier-protein] synthase family protein [bacterium]|nr:beta-ketoacyl-[acyl-carrier-protein] synthase family protein [bacterium]
MLNRIHITGMGIISAIGNSVEETFQSLNACKTGIGKIHHLKTRHRDDFLVGEIPFSNVQLAEMAESQVFDRTTLLGLIAAQQALINARIGDMKEARTGFISSTTVAGMPHSELLYKDFFENRYQGNFIDSHFSGVSTNVIASHLGIEDHVTTISTACSSAANAIMLGARLIRNGILDRVLVGGVDALSLFTLNGFNTLLILDKEWCKPFDDQRKGLNLGEGAAYLMLESEKMVKSSSKKSLALLTGYSNTNDAFHQTASSPEGQGACLAMQKALKIASLEPSQIDYINAHGTGTPNNDSSEGIAMQTVFGSKVPAFSSTKAYTGHTLAAAASIEAVISILSLQHNTIFPCLNREHQMTDLTICPVDTLQNDVALQHVMSNSFGFGGNCSSLIFSKN